VTELRDPAEATIDVRRSTGGPSYQEVLDTDSHEVPPILRVESNVFLGDHDIPVDRYLDREFHELEKERLWPFVWQMACREEEIPGVGDSYVYDIVDTSILIVRTEPDVIKAYYNACQHQGRLLRDDAGHVGGEIRCPFHGFCWNLDGSLKRVPSRWDYPTVRRDTFSLKDVRAETWGGFVFINMDLDAEPLHDFLDGIDPFFERYPLEDRYIAAHTQKVLRCNWKTAQDAFMEAYHTIATHPQILPATGDELGQYDPFDNFSRAIAITGIPSPSLKWTPTESEMAAVTFNSADPSVAVEDLVPEGWTFRAWGAKLARDQLRPVIGDAADNLCDSEMIDAFYYTVFPNLHPWGSYNRICFRFRPNGDNHEEAIMETYLLEPFVGERPPPAPTHYLGIDETHIDAPELGPLAQIIYQDEFNMPSVQKGMHTLRKIKPSGVTLGVYQYGKIRHFHNLYEEMIQVDKDSIHPEEAEAATEDGDE
jgi:phenylpropionate dioxygenase-like ring-hydroxylating dioxygenase large terminal subunit